MHPKLSVIVIVLGGAESLERCLRALDPQVAQGDVEVIIPIDDKSACCSELVRQRSDFIRLLALPGNRTYAELRSYAIQQATGSVIAITEDHCIPRADWCRQILAEHSTFPDAAIGGAVEKQTPDSTLNWSFYFADYVRYMNPIADGPANALTDCNVSYKRKNLLDVAHCWANEFHENVVHAALRERGYTLRAASRIVVNQQRSLRLTHAMWDRYAFGRLFASTRVGPARIAPRLLFALTTPLLPALLIARTFAQVFQKRRCLPEFIQALPHLILFSSLWAFGEFTGYVLGRPEETLSARPELHSEAQSEVLNDIQRS